MSSPGKLHDPLFHYETHFPERLSRLHLGNEFGHAASFKKLRKTRQRTGSRYKTQPVTFDEITEVDEEPASEEKGEAGSGEGAAAKSGRGLMGQFQAFSRSMDGLLPRIPEQSVQPPLSGPAGRRHHHVERPPSIPSIPERVETGGGGRSPNILPNPSSNPFFPSSVPIPIPSSSSSRPEDRLQRQEAVGERGGAASGSGLGEATLTAEGGGGGDKGGGEAGGGGGGKGPAIPPSSIGSRRQKVTAKAKKRQKAAEEKGATGT